MRCYICKKEVKETFTLDNQKMVCNKCLEKEIYKERRKIMKKYKRPSYRKEQKRPQEYTLGIYGKLIKKKHCRAYCNYHKCYLGGIDIKERKCKEKKCKYKENMKGNYYE